MHGLLQQCESLFLRKSRTAELPMLSPRGIAAGFAAFMLLVILCGLPRSARADYTQGSACSIKAAAGIGNSTVTDGNNLVCISNVWQYPKYVLGNAAAAAGASCSTYPAGALRYNTTSLAIEFCNGTNWSAFLMTQTAAPPTAPAGSGYFVMTQTSWTTPSSRANADSLCLTEVSSTHTGWAGYSDANSRGLLNSTHVKSFTCDNGSTCNNLLALGTYTFADANSSGHGGATFTADSSGLGPNDSANWSAANRFGGAYTYWTGRNVTNTSTAWGAGPSGDQGLGNCCQTWVGISTATDATRWRSSNPSVSNSYNLVCIVNP